MNKNENYWKRIIVVLCLGWVTIWIYRTWLTPIYGNIQETIGQQSGTALGLISSMYFFGYTGMQIPSGFLVDKVGRKAIIIPGFLLFALAAVVIGTATSIEMIYAGSLMAGIGTGAYYGSAYSLTATYIPDQHRTFATAIINSGSAVGMAVGLIGSSFLIKTLGLQWQTTMFIISGIILAMTLTFFIFIKKESEVADVANKPKEAVKVDGVVVADESFFSLRLISTYFLYFVTCYAYYMIVTWLPNYLENSRGFQGSAIGMASSLVAFASIPGALFFSRRSDKFKSKKVQTIVTLQILAAGMLAIVVISPNSTILLMGLILYGFLGKLAVDPILISYIIDRANPSKLGRSLGLFNFFGMTSSVVAPFLTGVITDITNTQVLGFYLSVGMLLLGTTFFYIANKRDERMS